MARVKFDELEKIDRTTTSLHVPVDAAYSVYDKNGQRYFQLDTYGCPDRKLTRKTSQTIQLSRSDAISLIRLLMKELSIDKNEL